MYQSHCFCVDYRDGYTIIGLTEPRLCGDVVADVLRIELPKLARDAKVGLIIVDFTKVTIVSSTVISAMISFRRLLDRRGVQLMLCSMNVPVVEIYRMLRLDENVFCIRDTIEECLSRDSLALSAPLPAAL